MLVQVYGGCSIVARRQYSAGANNNCIGSSLSSVFGYMSTVESTTVCRSKAALLFKK